MSLYNIVMEKHKAYNIKFKLRAVDVHVSNKKSIAASAWEFGMKHSSSNTIAFDECTSKQIILVFLSFALAQLFTNK